MCYKIIPISYGSSVEFFFLHQKGGLSHLGFGYVLELSLDPVLFVVLLDKCVVINIGMMLFCFRS